MFTQYFLDESYVLSYGALELEKRLNFMEDLIALQAKYDFQLRSRDIHVDKVDCNSV